ncbi:MAG: hypothetical protein ACI4U2_00370 [Christensenellaceae bacterium]
MEIDIVDMTEEELAALTLKQILIIREGQIRKNELTKELEENLESARLLLIANGVARSSIYEGNAALLREEYERQVASLREKVEFNVANSSPMLSDEPTDAPYEVNDSMSLLSRVEVIEAYYLSIEDPDYRMRLYASDETAKYYLGDYYAALYVILQQYSEG